MLVFFEVEYDFKEGALHLLFDGADLCRSDSRA